MVLTTTGAAKAVAKALPELAGKLTGNAIRVPTPNVSMAILALNLAKEVTRDELNNHLRWASIHSTLHKQIDYSASAEIASTDVVGARHAAVIDSRATIAANKRCVLYVWYDNEFGYSVQVVRILQRMAGIDYPFFPKAQADAA
jgi:glyceraldehyde 3-phosphate dehydrogenase